MNTTSVTLLERVRQAADQEAWRRFVQLYAPLMYAWARGTGLQVQDAADLVQDVFAVLVQRLPAFHYDRQGSFRAWLRTVLLNKWRENHRRRVPAPLDPAHGKLTELESPQDSGELGEGAHRRHHVRRVLELIENDFQPATWRAWREFVIAGRTAVDVAAELGLSVHAVYLAKARVLRRLRQELDGLLD